MDQNEIIEEMAVAEGTGSKGGILPVILKVAKPVAKGLLAVVGGYMLGRFARKRFTDESEPSDIETDDYADISYEDDDENPVDSDVE